MASGSFRPLLSLKQRFLHVSMKCFFQPADQFWRFPVVSHFKTKSPCWVHKTSKDLLVQKQITKTSEERLKNKLKRSKAILSTTDSCKPLSFFTFSGAYEPSEPSSWSCTGLAGYTSTWTRQEASDGLRWVDFSHFMGTRTDSFCSTYASVWKLAMSKTACWFTETNRLLPQGACL